MAPTAGAARRSHLTVPACPAHPTYEHHKPVRLHFASGNAIRDDRFHDHALDVLVGEHGWTGAAETRFWSTRERIALAS